MSPRANSSEGIGSEDDSTNDSENQEPEEVKADDEDEVVSRIVVRENSRIKLDCRANQAKPSAKVSLTYATAVEELLAPLGLKLTDF